MSLDTNLSEFTAFDSDADHPHEECGVFGVWAPDRDVARLTYFGLRALQHRGQESAGIAVGDGGTVMVRKDLGLVSRVFSNADIEALPGQLAVGHVRYGTAGAKSWEASQPHLSTINEVIVALAHNGTLVNTDDLRRQLIELGVPFNSNSDSEVAVKLIGYFTQETHHLREGIRKTMELIRGGYAMALINENALYAFRDPHGVRPLVLGRLTSDEGVAAANAAAAASALPSDAASAEDLVGDEVLASTAGWVVASETCALDIIGAEYVRDIRPGEILRISAEGLVSEQGVPAAEKTAHCIFEQVYFARPDSIVDGKSMYACRYDMGRKLALECPVEADMVIGTPDSGLPSAEGYAFESGIPYGTGLIKNRYVARTFIEPTQELRAMGVRLKLNPLKDVIEGKRIVVVDDSIVRGTTMVQLVR
ncbi:MAG: amidophosphoribosyltransferase, partial [Collinsella stercoris]|nr:amidophosphoribosyltransferase [Collinsella stercoris]